MSAIATSFDGNFVFLALENGSGHQVVVKASRADLATWSAAYSPGAGTAANVAAAGEDKMLFYGNFGSGSQVVEHIVSTAANTNISPAGLTTKVANTLEVNPSDPDNFQITVDTDQDLLVTADAGATWDTLNSALGFNATAQKVFWAGDYDEDRAFLAGQVTGAAMLKYTPNEGATLSDITGAGLGAAADIVGLDGVTP